METELHKLRIDKSQKAPRPRQSSMLPWVIVVILLLGGGGVGFLQYQKAYAAVTVDTIRVKVPEGTVQERDLVILQANGYIIAAHKIEVASKVVGRVKWIGVEMGDKITKGQELVRLEDEEYRARVVQQQGQLDNAVARLAELEAGSRPEEIAQALALWERARIEFENAERNFKRLNDLKGTRSITQPELDDAESLMKARAAQAESVRQQYELMKAGSRKEQVDAQRATVRQLEGALTMAKVDMDNTIIRAPITATVLERNVEVGEFVTTGFVGDRGAKGYVVSIADLNDLLVELDISQDDFAKVSAAQPCWIVTDAYRDRKYEGEVERISPLANRTKATVLVRVQVKNPDEKLKPDMNATVSFLSPEKLRAMATGAAAPQAERPAIRVPPSAIKDGSVFVVVDGKAVKQSVVVGSKGTNGDVEIRQGLSGGENLIVNPPASLKDGDKVKPQGTS